MHWAFFCLIAICLFGVSQVVDKIVLSKWDIPTSSYLVIIAFSSLLVNVLIFGLGIQPVASRLALLALVNGILFFFMASGFFYTLTFVDTPVLGGLFFIRLILIGVWGVIFFDEFFSPARYLGMALIVAAAIILTLVGRKPGQFEGLPGRAVIALGITCVISSVTNALAKYGVGVAMVDTKTWFFYERFGAIPALAVLFAVPSFRKKAFESIAFLKSRIFVIFVSEFLAFAAILAGLTAYRSGPLTLVAVLLSAIPIMTTLYILVLNSVFPGLVPDVSTRSHWHVRLVLILVGLIGVYLMVHGKWPG